MIGLIDYGMGNLLSVKNSFEMVGAEVSIINDPAALEGMERIVLPGVGTFDVCMRNLHDSGFAQALQREVMDHGRPILGICLGMQVMAKYGTEGGRHEGLGWFDAEVALIEPDDACLKIPHVGWNDLTFRADSPLFAGLPVAPDFYFVHSYHMRCNDPANVDATCEYGGPVTAAVRKDNVFATQFHPEKSQDFGLMVIENFLRWEP